MPKNKKEEKKDKYTDFHSQSEEDIIKEAEEQLNQETDEQLNKEVVETTEDETTPEETTEEPKEPKEEAKEESKEPKEPLIDTDKLSEQLADKITAKLEVKPEEKAETKDEAEQLMDQELKLFFEKHNRNPENYLEVAKISASVANQMVEKNAAKKEEQLKEQEKQEQEQQDLTKKAEEEAKEKEYQNYSNYWDEQMDEMVELGILPAKVDGKWTPEGQRVIDKLYTKMEEVRAERVKLGKRPVYSLFEIYDHHFTDPREQPPGATAPIAGAGTRSGQADSNKVSYASYRRMGFDDLLNED